MKAEVRDLNNAVKESIEIKDNIFGLNKREDILHSAVRNYLANQRQGTHSTKTRGKVRGGGKKPWKQKHTGRSRHGSNRSPIWKGGGIVFGPQPRDYSYKLPKKVKKLALYTALSVKVSEGNMVVVDNIEIEKPKTKNMISVLKNLELNNQKVLIVMPDKNENVILSARNIVGVKVMRARDINTYMVLTHSKLLITKEALATIEGVGNEASVLNN